jgi:hypothetical protein
MTVTPGAPNPLHVTNGDLPPLHPGQAQPDPPTVAQIGSMLSRTRALADREPSISRSLVGPSPSTTRLSQLTSMVSAQSSSTRASQLSSQTSMQSEPTARGGRWRWYHNVLPSAAAISSIGMTVFEIMNACGGPYQQLYQTVIQGCGIALGTTVGVSALVTAAKAARAGYKAIRNGEAACRKAADVCKRSVWWPPGRPQGWIINTAEGALLPAIFPIDMLYRIFCRRERAPAAAAQPVVLHTGTTVTVN